MKKDIRIKISLILNLLIFIITVFATFAIFTSFEFMGRLGFEDNAPHFKIFKYFTVDSNIFAALMSLIYFIYYLKNQADEKKFTRIIFLAKLAATTAVTLTMMVTVFFLGPHSEIGFKPLFINASFFMHLITPLLCITTFVFFDISEIVPMRMSITGIIPMLLYAVYYVSNILLHLENNKTSHDYDLYGFLDGGLQAAWIAVPVIIGITCLFAFSLLALNRKMQLLKKI